MKTISRGLVAFALALPFAAAGARDAPTTTVLGGHPVHARDIAKLSIGHSTRADVERVLGAPDDRGADGSLVYRASAVRRTGTGIGAREDVVGTRSTIFRFEGGDRLTRICRERS